MSKYEPLWRFLSSDGSASIQFSFERIDEILGFPIDHSFLHYKLEAEQYGYRVEKISLKAPPRKTKAMKIGQECAIIKT